MDYEIISEREYESLPADPEEQFVVLEAICRRNMNQMMNVDSSGNFDSAVRLQYMSTVWAAARELNVGDFQFPTFRNDFDYAEFADFL